MFFDIIGARFSMRATILKPGDAAPDPVDPDIYGEWVLSQNPLTHQVIKIWEPFPDLPDTPDIDESVKFGRIKCIARGIVDGGVRTATTTENFGDAYENLEFVKMWVPPKTKITKRDRITNITNKKGDVVYWMEEEFEDTPKATVFNVNSVVPLFDPFNQHTHSFVLLEKAEVDNAV